MIDIENEIFTSCADKLRENFETIYITGEYVKVPPTFPCVSIMEVDNQVYRNGRDSTNIENYASVVYEVQVYSNKTKGKKAECKAILSLVDDVMSGLGLTRTVYNVVPNEADATIFRLVARYRAIVSKEKVIFRR